MSEIEKMTAFNFSGIYEREEWMSSWKDRWISFRDLEGTDGYCTEEAAQEIRQRISDMGEGGIHFLDSGNYHYLSKFWLEKILRQKGLSAPSQVFLLTVDEEDHVVCVKKEEASS